MTEFCKNLKFVRGNCCVYRECFIQRDVWRMKEHPKGPKGHAGVFIEQVGLAQPSVGFSI